VTTAFADSHMDWSPRRRSTLAQARRRSALLKTFRYVCIAVSVLSVTSLFVSGVSRALGGTLLGRPLTADSPRMINPRFTGRNGGDSAYVITAASALRRSAAKEAVDLDQPVYSTKDGMTIKAPTGFYDPDAQILELTGGVVFIDKKGNRFVTRTAKLDAKTNTAFGAQPLQGAGPLGDVRSDAYEIDAKSGHVRMSGRVSGTLKD